MPCHNPRRLALKFCVAACLLSSNADAEAAIFQPIVDPSGTASYYQVQDISGDGSFIVGDARNGNDSRAFRWSVGGAFQYLGDLNGNPNGEGYAHGVSFDGSIVTGRANGPQGVDVFLWSEGPGMTTPAGLHGFDTVPHALSDDGTTIVGQTKPDNQITKAFVWDAQNGVNYINSIDNSVGPGDFMSTARGVSDDGSAVAGTMRVSIGSESAFEGFVWTREGGVVGVSDLPPEAPNAGNEYNSEIFDLSSDGTTAVGKSVSSHPYTEAISWTAHGGLVGLDEGLYFETPYSSASAVSSDGSVIAGEIDQPGLDRSVFLWTSTDGLQDLSDILEQSGADLLGWRINELTAMSNDGTKLVGYGYDADGEFGSWYADLSGAVPEPSVLNTILMPLALGVAGYTRRRA